MPASATTTVATRSLYTLEEIRDIVRGDVGLRDSTLASNADIDAWGNRAQMEIARRIDWFKDSLVMGTVADQGTYRLPVSAASRAKSIIAVFWQDRPLYHTTTHDLDRGDPYWRTYSGTPSFYFVDGAAAFGLYQAPDTTDADDLVVHFWAIPPKASGDDDYYYGPHGSDEAIIAYCSWRLALKDAHGEGARRVPEFKQEWEDQLASLAAETRRTDGEDIVAFGADAVNGMEWSIIPAYTSISAP